MGGPLKWALTLAAVFASAVCLAACGGDDGDSTASTPTPPAANGEPSDGGDAGEGPAPTTSPDGGDAADSGDSSGEESAPEGSDLPDRGTVSARSKSFQKYSGKGQVKLHLAEFGTEADSSDRTAIEAAVVSYLEATGNGEWEKACDYVSGMTKSQFAELARQSSEPTPPSCGEILQALVKSSSGQAPTEPVYASEGIASARIKDGPGGGFALFRGSDGEDHWMAVRREDGNWGVLSIAPQPFLQ